LWENAKSIKDLKKFKRIWAVPKTESAGKLRAPKSHTVIGAWRDDLVETWYFSVQSTPTKRAIHKIQKDTGWPKALSLVVAVGPSTFRQLKLGDIAVVADLAKKRDSSATIKFARVFDRSRVETEEGDLHLAYEVKQSYQIDKDQFYQMLKNAGIATKGSEIMLGQDQIKLILATLSSVKTRRKRKKRQKVKSA
jgi:hypothetical protein